jgi:tryptophanyl-tRNA synthetase
VINKGAYIPSLDGKGAMSKSANGGHAMSTGNINLSDDHDAIRKKLAQAVTDPARIRRQDPGEPTRCPVYTIHGCYTPQPTLKAIAEGCRSAAIGCLDCKRTLADEIVEDLAPIQARRTELLERPDEVCEILAQGAAACCPLAQETVREVRHRMGLG